MNQGSGNLRGSKQDESTTDSQTSRNTGKTNDTQQSNSGKSDNPENLHESPAKSR